MNVPRSVTRLRPSWRKLHKAVTICLLVSLLAGLIPPPLVSSVTNLSGLTLPQPSAARAAPAEGVTPATAGKLAAAPDAESLAAPVANPNRAPAESLGALPAFQAATDIDLITNISSDKMAVIPQEAVAFTVTVENRGPATATNVDWLVEIGSADTITNTGCTSSGGATCPADFTISVPEATAQLTAVIPSMPADSNITLTFDTTTAYLQGAAKAVSTVTPNGQTDAVPATNQADINISIIAPALSYAVTKSVSFEDAGGNPIVTPTSGDYAIWEVVITNDGIDDVYDLYMEDFASVLVGTGDVRTDGQYAPGTTFESMTCVNAANGAVCPPDITYTEIELG